MRVVMIVTADMCVPRGSYGALAHLIGLWTAMLPDYRQS